MTKPVDSASAMPRKISIGRYPAATLDKRKTPGLENLAAL
jgi:hypothetical protein